MTNPYTLEGKPVRVSFPQYDWEKQSGNVNEGPAFLKHGSKLHILYSASQCHFENYCLGMLTASVGSNYMDSASWNKSAKPVFQQCPANNAYAVGHHYCIQTPGGEWWLIYHGKYENNRNGQAPRDARMQQFTFNGDMPDFGVPVKAGQPIACPDSDPDTK
jgi:GH43 family beta-xylosidase